MILAVFIFDLCILKKHIFITLFILLSHYYIFPDFKSKGPKQLKKVLK